MTTERDRVISITLSEAEWRAFVARHPQPVDWLRERIRNEVQGVASANLQFTSENSLPSIPNS
jgi:hypothetical protein